MKTILVPIDFSPISDCAVTTALALADASGSSLVFFHVVKETYFADSIAAPFVDIEAVYKEVLSAARRTLDQHVNSAALRGIHASAFAVVGSPVSLILDKAEEVEADLIVMGSHGHGTLHHLIAGSTAAGVLKGSLCPLVIVPTSLAGASVAPVAAVAS